MAIEDEKSRRGNKYALTLGIKGDGIIPHAISSRMLCYGDHETAHGNDWHVTEAEASPEQSNCDQ